MLAASQGRCAVLRKFTACKYLSLLYSQFDLQEIKLVTEESCRGQADLPLVVLFEFTAWPEGLGAPGETRSWCLCPLVLWLSE